jgi:tetratricopeptide (TPR) repeat protein
MVQWFHTYEMTDDTLRLLLRTFAASFEQVTLWSPKAGDLLLLGSREPLDVDFSGSTARLADRRVRAELGRLGIGSFATLLSLQVIADKGVRTVGGEGIVNEDGFPALEYAAPKAFFLGQASSLLAAYDERLLSPWESPLYLARYGQERALTTEDLKELTLYHLRQGPVVASSLAHRLLGAWLEHSPHDTQARWTRARLEQLQGNFSAAIEDLRFLLKTDPARLEYLEAAADAEWQVYLNRRSVVIHTSPNPALDALRRLLDLTKNKRAVVYQKMAQVYASAGDVAFALHYMEKGATEASANGDITGAERLWLATADLAEKAHDTEKAIRSVRRALSLNSHNDVAQGKLQQLVSKISEKRSSTRLD